MSDEGALTDCYFLSYSRADQDFALRFATDLRAREVSIWIDQLDIRPSEHWDRAIERAVRDCCGLVVILSPRSVESDNVADEISYAIDRGKPVLPVMIERCSMPLRITRMQMIDATGDYDRALQQCLEAIASKDGFEKPAPKAAPRSGPKRDHRHRCHQECEEGADGYPWPDCSDRRRQGGYEGQFHRRFLQPAC